MNKIVNINGVEIGAGHPPYIVAELSGNHNGSIETALKMLEVAKDAGAHAIKLQTYTADTMTIDSDKSDFKIEGGLWDGHTLYDLYQWAHTPWDWHPILFKRAEELGITIFSSPFDESSVDFLESLGAPAYKVASFEATDLPLIKYIAKKGKPIVLSTGMANLEEIEEAVNCIKSAGNQQLILLHCISAYPTPVEQMNIATVADLEKRFNCVVGLSDHSLSNIASVTSVALGAAFIEKHVTMSRSEPGPDASFSLEPSELTQLVTDCTLAWQAKGQAGYHRKEAEQENVKFRRSIYVTEDVAKGETFTVNNVRRIRPGYGLECKYFDDVLGKTASEDISRGTPLQWHLLEK